MGLGSCNLDFLSRANGLIATPNTSSNAAQALELKIRIGLCQGWYPKPSFPVMGELLSCQTAPNTIETPGGLLKGQILLNTDF